MQFVTYDPWKRSNNMTERLRNLNQLSEYIRLRRINYLLWRNTPLDTFTFELSQWDRVYLFKLQLVYSNYITEIVLITL